jgi:transcriptional regulator of heat shock response
VKILNACLSRDGVRITIGHENPDPDLRQVALVTAASRSIPMPPGGWGWWAARGWSTGA